MPRAIVLLSALLYILSFPNFNFSWLAWIALVPLALISLRSTPREAFFAGWAAGTLAFSGILYWIIVTFQAANQPFALAVLALLALAAYLGLYWGAWAWCLSRAASRPPLQFSLFGAATWVALEYLRTYLFSGFPWTLLADSQVHNLPLIQIASVTGVYGVSFLVVWINLSLIPAITHFRGQSPMMRYIRLWGLSPAVVLFCYLWGGYRIRHATASESSPSIHVALLQGNVDQYKKWDKAYVQDIQRTYEKLNEQAVRQKPHMILWPETSVPGYLLQEPSLQRWLEAIVRKTKTNHLIGAPSLKYEKAYNSAFSLTPESRIEGQYSKHHLVPFGEIVPWAGVLDRWIRVLNDLGGFTAGQGSSVLSVGGLPVGVNICYEAIFPDLARRSVRDGAQLIANLTNDGWYMKTAAPYQHFAPNIFRAVENNRWVLRADNTGISALIDPTGRVIAASPIFETAVVEGAVEPRTTQTPYTRWGDLFAWICCGFCAWVCLRGILRP